MDVINRLGVFVYNSIYRTCAFQWLPHTMDVVHTIGHIFGKIDENKAWFLYYFLFRFFFFSSFTSIRKSDWYTTNSCIAYMEWVFSFYKRCFFSFISIVSFITALDLNSHTCTCDTLNPFQTATTLTHIGVEKNPFNWLTSWFNMLHGMNQLVIEHMHKKANMPR